jgi:tellurite resistance protein TehA-like permease
MICRIRPVFDLQYWSMVFPLGMYTAATWVLSRQNGLEFLAVILHVSIWIALASWLLGFAAITQRLSCLCREQRSLENGDAEARL